VLLPFAVSQWYAAGAGGGSVTRTPFDKSNLASAAAHVADVLERLAPQLRAAERPALAHCVRELRQGLSSPTDGGRARQTLISQKQLAKVRGVAIDPTVGRRA